MTSDEYSTLINIEQQKLGLANSPEKKQVIQTRIKKLQLEKEIVVIRRRIEQLS